MTNRSDIQTNIVKAILESKDTYGRCRCTVEAVTGIGKTFIALMTIKELNPKTVLFLAETTLREQGIKDDIVKFNEMFNYNIFEHHDIKFACYQSAYKWKGSYYDIVIADGFVRSCLIDWNSLRASYTPCSSNDYIIVKEMKIGQSAAKRPYRMNVQRLSPGRRVGLL